MDVLREPWETTLRSIRRVSLPQRQSTHADEPCYAMAFADHPVARCAQIKLDQRGFVTSRMSAFILVYSRLAKSNVGSRQLYGFGVGGSRFLVCGGRSCLLQHDVTLACWRDALGRLAFGPTSPRPPPPPSPLPAPSRLSPPPSGERVGRGRGVGGAGAGGARAASWRASGLG